MKYLNRTLSTLLMEMDYVEDDNVDDKNNDPKGSVVVIGTTCNEYLIGIIINFPVVLDHIVHLNHSAQP